VPSDPAQRLAAGSDWLPNERIDLPLVYLPPALVTGPELYGKYDATTQSYLLALALGMPADPLTPSGLTTGTDSTHPVSTTDELDNRLVGDKVTNATQTSYVMAVDAATNTLTISPAITGQISSDSITIEHAIGINTAFWLNVDPNTGDPSHNGADYAVVLWGSGNSVIPELYQYQSGAWQPQGALSSYAVSSDQLALEVAIPASLLGLGVTSPQPSITLVADISNAIFLPADYADGSLTLPGAPLPPRTDLSKRVGVVYCTATAQNFYGANNPPNSRAYSQLFMAMQHQSMMSGVPFDLLTETDLTDVSKIVNYDALIFPYCANVPLADLDAIHDTLYKAVYHYGIGIITADNFITDDENGAAIPGDAYRFMNQLLGLEYVDGFGPVTTLQHHASDVTHPVMRGYDPNELIMDLPGNWFNYYVGLVGQPVTQLVTQTVTGTPNGSLDGTWPSLLAVTTGARHVHFSSIELLGNSNLVSQAIQWVLYGDSVPVGLKLSRNNAVLV
jgi:serralysin